MPKMNVKLLRKIQKHILAEPKRYEQNVTITYGIPGEEIVADESNPEPELLKAGGFAPCGTAACIGGWGQLLGMKRPSKTFNWEQARRALGLDHSQAAKLFAYSFETDEIHSWPEKFRLAYAKAKTQRQKARVAVRRIDHFIATEGAE